MKGEGTNGERELGGERREEKREIWNRVLPTQPNRGISKFRRVFHPFFGEIRLNKPLETLPRPYPFLLRPKDIEILS